MEKRKDDCWLTQLFEFFREMLPTVSQSCLTIYDEKNNIREGYGEIFLGC